MEWNWHNKISISKSVVRFIGYFVLMWVSPTAGGLLIFAEILGIVEEFK